MRWEIWVFLILVVLCIFIYLIYSPGKIDSSRVIGMIEEAKGQISESNTEPDSPEVSRQITDSESEENQIPLSSDCESDSPKPQLAQVRIYSKINDLLPDFATLKRDHEKFNKTYTMSLGQYICKRTFEAIFKRKFRDDYRPDFLYNPEKLKKNGDIDRRCNLEYDGYNDELKISFETNGEQHYIWTENTMKKFPGFTREKFIEQIRRDIYKVNVSPELGVTLIVIPLITKKGTAIAYSKLPEIIAGKIPPKFNQYRHDLVYEDDE